MVPAAKGAGRRARTGWPKPTRNAEREHRITVEIIVDAHGPEGQALGWYYYLEEKVHFPFSAKADKDTKETIAGRHCWVAQGYGL